MYGYIVIYDLIKCVIDFYSQFGVKDKRHQIYCFWLRVNSGGA